ncbi:double zinc ribbon domain-containing protein [Deinococcus enclensis]|uniref:double zinc ribbon domain-containing protein n=1 Tax=Deinococcus enclensis TaxID=1049582 RepID=UPI00351C4993
MRTSPPLTFTGHGAAQELQPRPAVAPGSWNARPGVPAAAYSHCPGCRRVTPVQDGLVFCPLCGRRLMYACPVCGAPLHHPSPPGCRACGPLT